MAVFTWDDVLAKTGANAKRKGLESFAGAIVSLFDFKAEERGRTKKHFVLTAEAVSDGRPAQRIIVPERYADRIRELMDHRAAMTVDGEAPEPIRINAKVESGPRGAMLKPVEVKAAPDPNAPRRGRKPRKADQAAD